MPGDFEEMEKRFVGEPVAQQAAVLPRRPTKRQQLEQKRKMFEEALQRVEAALDCLDKNPNFEKMLNVLQDAE